MLSGSHSTCALFSLHRSNCSSSLSFIKWDSCPRFVYICPLSVVPLGILPTFIPQPRLGVNQLMLGVNKVRLKQKWCGCGKVYCIHDYNILYWRLKYIYIYIYMCVQLENENEMTSTHQRKLADRRHQTTNLHAQFRSQ